MESLNVIIRTYDNRLLVKFRYIAMLYNNAVISFYEMLSVIPFTFNQSIGWGEAVYYNLNDIWKEFWICIQLCRPTIFS